MTVETPTLRHLGNEAADKLVLYLQDDAPPEVANAHIGCNPRCHAFDAGVVAGRMPAILEEERERTLTRAFAALRGEMRLASWEHVVTVVLRAVRGGRGEPT